MSRTPQTPLVILGLLSIEPMSGYELKQAIERTIGHFWHESYGQIYPTLKALHAAGEVRCTEQAQGERRSKMYELTEAGRARLRGWLGENPQPHRLRNELLLKVFFGRHAEAARVRELLQTECKKARGEAAALNGVAAALAAEEPDAPDLEFWLMTLDYGHRAAVARADWAAAWLKKVEV